MNVTLSLSIKVNVMAGFMWAPLKSPKAQPTERTTKPMPRAVPTRSEPESGTKPRGRAHCAATRRYVASNSASTSRQKAPLFSSSKARLQHSSALIFVLSWFFLVGNIPFCYSPKNIYIYPQKPCMRRALGFWTEVAIHRNCERKSVRFTGNQKCYPLSPTTPQTVEISPTTSTI